MNEFFQSINVPLDADDDLREHEIFRKANTKEKRDKQLKLFFKSALNVVSSRLSTCHRGTIHHLQIHLFLNSTHDTPCTLSTSSTFF